MNHYQKTAKPSDLSKVAVDTGIDLFKVIAATLVVILHAVETTSWVPCEIKYVLTRFAVPFFFIASGYYFCNGLFRASNHREYFIRYEKNVLKLFVVWALILYLPFEIKSYIEKYAGEKAIRIILLLIRRTFIIGPGPYWYLLALMLSAGFIYLCFCKKWELVLAFEMTIGIVMEILYSSLQAILSNVSLFRFIFNAIYTIFSWEFNFLMFGIPFMGLGYFIRKNQLLWKKNTAIVVLIVATLFRFVEYNFPIYKSADGTVSQLSIAFIPQAIAYFMLAKNIKLKISKNWSLCLRQYSSFIYFSHAIILYELLNPLLSKLTDLPVYADWMIAPKVIATLLLCTILFILIKKINNKHLKVLING